MSTAFHPQTDGQTKTINEVIESYLRSYCNYEQNNWAEMLPITEYAYNNSKYSSTKISPVYTNYGYEPRTIWPTKVSFKSPASEMFSLYMTEVLKKLSNNLERTEEMMGEYYNTKRRLIELFKANDFVMLKGINIRTKGQYRKLDDTMYGPFTIVKVGHNDRYCKLELPESWKIHPTFNMSLLERYRGKNPRKHVIEIETDDAEWTIESIIPSGPSQDDAKYHVFFVKWEGFSHKENTWESFYNVNDNARVILERYEEDDRNMEKDKRFSEKKDKRKTQQCKKKN